MELVKQQIVDGGEEATISRISVATGLYRSEVKRVLGMDPTAPKEQGQSISIMVISQWQTDRDFVNKSGAPRKLTFGSDSSEFNLLVKKVSRDVNAATVLYDLLRVGAVERTDSGVVLKMQSYAPKGDMPGNFKILSQDIEELTEIVERNVLEAPMLPDHHARTEYDRIRAENIDEIKAWIVREGHLLHKRSREFLSQLDQDVNPDPNYKGKFARVILGSFGRLIS